jgi:hypothetical protein
MSARKARTPARPRPYDEFRNGTTPPSSRKKPRAPRVRLTHLEVRRGETLRLRIALADDAIADVGDELGALIKKIAPSTRIAIVAAPVVAAEAIVVTAPAPDFIVTRQHDGDDGTYHASLREHFTELFSSLCDTSLADALEIARNERARRAEGGN